MDDGGRATAPKAATAARMYDYFLGGIHNFPADQEAGRQIVERFPFVPALARANRAFLGRAVRYLVGAGVRQFLDVGSGIPTAGNVHQIAQALAPECRVVYVDIDPVAVSESLEILAGNDRATAILGDLSGPQPLLEHPTVRRALDLDAPVGLLLVAVLHFVPDDTLAYRAAADLVAAAPPGSYLVASHTATETFHPMAELAGPGEDVYKRQTATPGTVRTRAEVERFFTGLELVDPGVTWVHEWRPDPGEPAPAADTPFGGGVWCGVGRKPQR
ncbi:MAG TPA: SAM-dependent methyltransferase [Rugosimonospora sp.]|nr:SAM-dependent methyltransferase [Rugosimonospora sp.]